MLYCYVYMYIYIIIIHMAAKTHIPYIEIDHAYFKHCILVL